MVLGFREVNYYKLTSSDLVYDGIYITVAILQKFESFNDPASWIVFLTVPFVMVRPLQIELQ